MKKQIEIAPEELEKIERFLTGAMDVSEASAFRETIANDISLQEKTEQVRLLLIGIAESSLEKKLGEFRHQLASKKITKASAPLFTIKKMLVAASVMFAIVTSVWWFTRDKDKPSKIYSKYYSPDPGLATVMSNHSNYDFERAMVDYKNGNYSNALDAWKNQLPLKKDNDTLLYFIAAANQALGEEEEAIIHLKKVATDSLSAFNHDACWYLGLCYLKKGEKKLAIQYLEMSDKQEAASIIKAINAK